MHDHRHDASLTHVDAAGRATMVDVATKPATARRATARAVLRTTPHVAAQVGRGDMPKGDVVAVCRIAGIQAAKRTAELVPLAHQVPLSSVDVEVHVDAGEGTVTFDASARTTAGTGVEIEAMVAASIAAVTCYDMVKAVDRSARVDLVQVTQKHGGRSGSFVRGSIDGPLEPAEATRE